MIALYEDMLNEAYGDVNICGLNYNAAYALETIDKTAYNEGFNNFIDGEGFEELGGVWFKYDEIERLNESDYVESEAG